MINIIARYRVKGLVGKIQLHRVALLEYGVVHLLRSRVSLAELSAERGVFLAQSVYTDDLGFRIAFGAGDRKRAGQLVTK